MPTASGPQYPFYGAFESTRLSRRKADILGTTRHAALWRSDLELLLDSNLIDLRYPAPWNRIERQPGVFDWRWMDGPMRFLREHGMRPVMDPIHHISYPEWLTGGFSNPEFPSRYQRYVTEFVRRYPWVERYTVFNEPLPTAILCSYAGIWDPNQRSDRDFVAMAIRIARAIGMATEAIRNENPSAQFVHVDTCEGHAPLNEGGRSYSEYANHRRFLMHDLVLGGVDREHPLHGYLVEHGAQQEDLCWLADHPARFDVLALDYYPHCEMEWRGDKRGVRLERPARRPRGFAALAQDYIDRYRVPVMLGETNIRGSVRDRIAWLRFMLEQCDQVAAKADFRGFCWFPSIDSTDWCSLCRVARRRVDPQGVWSLDESRRQRIPTEFTEWFVAAAKGRATWRELPDHEFEGAWTGKLDGYLATMDTTESEEEAA